MSGAQTSTFADPNILLRTLSGQQTAGVLGQQIENQQNQLLMPYRVQGAQQQVGAAEIDTMGRAAAGLLSLPDENARAAAYPGVVQQLQANGFAKNAPAQYPGEATLRTFVGQALPVEKQYEMGILVPPGLSAALRGGQPPSGAPPVSSQGSATPPPARTGDFATDLATSESGGRPGIINSSGYTGLYQFGKQRLADLGYYTPAPGENMADNTNWAGKVSIPGFNVTDQASFAANPAAQKVAFGTHLANIDQAIDNTPGAANMDRNGLRAVAHLGGIDGMQKFVASGGAYNPADANGTRLSAYYQRFSGGGATPPASTAPGTTPPSGTTAVAATTPAGGKAVVIGDSLASSGGLGGSGVVGASPGAIRAQIADGASKGAYTGQDVVLSSGASNAPGDMANVEAQLKLLRDAGSVTLLGVGPGIEAKNPGTNAALQKLAAQYGARFQPLPTDQMSPDGVHPTAAGYAALKTATAPPGAAPQSGRYQVASNAPTPPPSATAPPTASAQPPALPAVAQNQLAPPAPQPPPATQPPAVQPPAAQPGTAAAARANLPHYTDVPSGANSPQRQQFQAIQDQINQLIPYAQLPAAKAKIAQLQAQQQVLMSTDSVVQTQEGPYHPLTGVLDKPIEPLANYVFSPDAGGPGVPGFIDTTQTHEPKISPARRLMQRPDGTVIDDTGRIVSPADLPGAAAAAAAKAQGTATGTEVAKTVPQLADMGRQAAIAEGNIDYGLNQLHEAQKAGIPTGYFSGALATAAAAAKSLGIDTSALGVDPKAVGDIQTAQKTLAVVGGAILQNVIGKGVITDDKVQAFIHTQPGIETDPNAIERILNWARSQFTYEREMAHAGMAEAAAPGRNGMLPLDFTARYYNQHGFAPIYDQGTGEMQQPDGKQPSRTTPAAATASGPVTVNNTADYAKVPSGAQYRDPSGVLRRKP